MKRKIVFTLLQFFILFLALTPVAAQNIVVASKQIFDSGPLLGRSNGNSNGVIETGEAID